MQRNIFLATILVLSAAAANSHLVDACPDPCEVMFEYDIDAGYYYGHPIEGTKCEGPFTPCPELIHSWNRFMTLAFIRYDLQLYRSAFLPILNATAQSGSQDTDLAIESSVRNMVSEASRNDYAQSANFQADLSRMVKELISENAIAFELRVDLVGDLVRVANADSRKSIRKFVDRMSIDADRRDELQALLE